MRESRQTGLNIVVAFAVCLVVYSFLGGLWLNRHGYSPWQLVLVREWIGKPLGLGEDFGFLGIALLFLVAGYRVTARAVTGTTHGLVTALLLRAYPPVLLAVTLSALLLLVGGEPLTEPAEVPVGLAAFLGNVLLVRPTLVMLTWVVLVGAVFAVLTVLLAPVLRRRPLVAVVVQLLVVVTAVVLIGLSGEYQRAGMIMSFVPLPVIGELIWLVRSGRLSSWAAGPLGVVCLAVLGVAEQLFRPLAGWWYPLAGVYAVLLMLLAVRSESPLGHSRPVRWLATRGYQVFLLTGVVGYAVFGAAHLLVPLPVAGIVALVVTALTAEIAHYLIDLPARQTANWWASVEAVAPRQHEGQRV